MANVASTGGTDWREFFSYVWQFYLPRTPLQNEFGAIPWDHPAYHVFLKGGWAAFGWLEIRFPRPVYWGFAAVTAGVAAAAGVVLWRTRASIDRGVALFILTVVGTLVAALHWAEFHQYKAQLGGFIQGRYLFPLIALAGLAVAQAIRLLPHARRQIGAAAVLGLLLVFQLFSLGLVIERFYV